MAAAIEVRESQVQDVLASYPHIVQGILALKEIPRLVAREMIVPSGRLDLLYATGQALTLIELKVEAAKSQFIGQVLSYRDDLEVLQVEGRLIRAPIRPVLLCPMFSGGLAKACADAGVDAVTYSPADVLAEFLRALPALSHLVSLRPFDHGLWNIGLIHRALYSLGSRSTAASIATVIGRSVKTVANQFRLASDLRLVQQQGSRYALTPLGNRYVRACDVDMPVDQVSEEQAGVLRDFIVEDPFASTTVLGIYSIVEAVSTLARNTYPVPSAILTPFFRDAAGKHFEWSQKKSVYNGTRMYSNYAIDLGLLGRSGDALYLTPDGIRFILLLQLHKSLKLIDVVNLSR